MAPESRPASTSPLPSWLSDELNGCLEGCLSAHEAALVVFRHSLEKGGRYLGAGHLRALEDAIQITQLAADYLLRGSDFYLVACDACADICESCASDLSAFGDEEIIRMNAASIRLCADSCRRLSRSRAA